MLTQSEEAPAQPIPSLLNIGDISSGIHNFDRSLHPSGSPPHTTDASDCRLPWPCYFPSLQHLLACVQHPGYRPFPKQGKIAFWLKTSYWISLIFIVYQNSRNLLLQLCTSLITLKKWTASFYSVSPSFSMFFRQFYQQPPPLIIARQYFAWASTLFIIGIRPETAFRLTW